MDEPNTPTAKHSPAIRPDARLVAVGATGTGKSTVLRWLFATQFGRRSGHHWRVLIDPQDAYELVPERGTCEARTVDGIDWRAPLIRFIPGEDPKDWERIYRELNRRANVCVWLDEAAAAPHPGTREAAPLRTLQTQGRKYNRAHLVATQFPVSIERTLIDQAEHMFLFQMRRPEDIDRVRKMAGYRSARDLEDVLRAFPPSADGRPSHQFVWADMTRGRNETRAPLPPRALAQADRVVRAVV